MISSHDVLLIPEVLLETFLLICLTLSISSAIVFPLLGGAVGALLGAAVDGSRGVFEGFWKFGVFVFIIVFALNVLAWLAIAVVYLVWGGVTNLFG